MKKFFTLLIACLASALPLLAQDVDDTFVFVDAEGNVFENGATIIRTEVVPNGDQGEKIDAGVFVLNNLGASDFLKMHYTINQIDNGAFQICFPTTCNTRDAVGTYETSAGQLMDDMQDITSEWLPVEDGVCDVTLLIEVLTKKGGFPPSYEHKAYGPSLNIMFVKGDLPAPGPVKGDVNGDGEINIADVNAIIGMILSGSVTDIADVNGDGEVNISDINTVIDIILNM